jgi:hypothetical protein
MASSGKVTINAEHLNDGDGTLQRALELWSCRNGPVPYNYWQSVYFGLLRDHGYNDEYYAQRPAPGPVERQARVRSLWQEIQKEQHGDDHAAAALIRVKAAGQSIGVKPSAPAPGIEATIAAADAAHAAAEPALIVDGGYGAFTQEELIPGQMSVADYAFGGSAALGRRDPIPLGSDTQFAGVGAEHPVRNLETEMFQLHTPRNASPVPTSDSPDRLLTSKDAEVIWECGRLCAH